MNNVSPTTKTHLWPNRSPSRPAGIRASPKASAYPEMIQDSVDSDASRSVRIVGSATLTIVASISDIDMPMSSTPSASQARRGLTSVVSTSAWGVVVVSDIVLNLSRVVHAGGIARAGGSLETSLRLRPVSALVVLSSSAA